MMHRFLISQDTDGLSKSKGEIYLIKNKFNTLEKGTTYEEREENILEDTF